MQITGITTMVREFYIAFGQAAPNTPQALTREQRNMRDKFMMEEINEYKEAGHSIRQIVTRQVARIDAMADLAYFAAGSSVGAGADLPEIDLSIYRLTSTTKLQLAVYNYTLSDDLPQQIQQLGVIVGMACANILFLGADPQKVLQVIHEANMRKLWPDGKPRYRHGDGKVLKPPNWIGPEEDIARLFWDCVRRKT